LTRCPWLFPCSFFLLTDPSPSLLVNSTSCSFDYILQDLKSSREYQRNHQLSPLVPPSSQRVGQGCCHGSLVRSLNPSYFSVSLFLDFFQPSFRPCSHPFLSLALTLRSTGMLVFFFFTNRWLLIGLSSNYSSRVKTENNASDKNNRKTMLIMRWIEQGIIGKSQLNLGMQGSLVYYLLLSRAKPIVAAPSFVIPLLCPREGYGHYFFPTQSSLRTEVIKIIHFSHRGALKYGTMGSFRGPDIYSIASLNHICATSSVLAFLPRLLYWINLKNIE
jgi:hypothetical protein